MASNSGSSKVTVPTTVAAAIVAGAAFLIWSSFYTVEQGERAIVLRFGEVSGISDPGLHFKLPFIDEIRTLSVRTVKVFSDLPVYSKDAQSVTIVLSSNYKLNPSSVANIYSQYGMNYVDAIIMPKLRAIPKDVIGTYAAVDIVQNRDAMSKTILNSMDEYFSPLGIIIESINVENIEFSDSYEQSVEARMQAEVEVQKVKQNLEREKLNAEMVRVKAQGAADARIAEAKADAEATILRGEAEAKAIKARTNALSQNPIYVKLIEAEKWDGKLPETIIPNQSIPILGGK